MPPLADACRPVAAVLLSTLIGLCLAGAPQAATIKVNNAADYDFGIGPSNGDGLGCTLRKALANANTNSQVYSACTAGSGSSNTIEFEGVAAITLGTYGSPLFVNRSLTIKGPIVIDGNNQGDIFRVGNSGITLTLDGVTLKKGSNSAVQIMSSNSSLVANGCSFIDNTNPGSGGGAINSSGPIQITACNFVGNTSNSSGEGGGAIRLSSSGQSTISLSNFTNNSAKTRGGAISFSNPGSLAWLSINASVFTNNSAEAVGGAAEGGGAIWHQQGLLTVLQSTFVHNSVSGQGRGGALHLAVGSPVAVVEHNLFTLNEAKGSQGMGGAIYAARAVLANGNSFIGNSAHASGGRGGAIAATVKRKGGFNTDAPGFMLSNSTLFENSAGYGGAIYNLGPETGNVERGITLLNVTVDSNSAGQANGGGGIYAAEVQVGSAPETDLRNTILSNNTANGAADNCNSNAGIAIQNNGGNLLWPAASCAGASFSAAEVGDPKLSLPTPSVPPPVLVMEPKSGSAALQRGVPAVCAEFPVLGFDQRVFLRPNPANTPCDTGAIESANAPPAPALDVTPNAGLAFGQVPVGSSVQLQATITNPGSLPLQGLQLAVTGARFSQSATTCGSTLAANASCTVTVQYQPNAAQSHAGQLNATGDGGLADSIGLSGTGFVASPNLNLTPDAGLAFGNLQVGFTSAPLEATVTNAGNVDLTGLGFSVAAPFQLSAGGTCGSSLAQGASCTQRVVFAPSGPGPANASLVVTAAGASDAITVTGNGTIPATLVLSPTGGLAFGRVPINTWSDTQALTLTNTGTESAVSVGSSFIGASNGFALAAQNCPSVLPGGQSCTFELRFMQASTSPMTAQFRANAIFVNSNTVTLTAQGYRPAQVQIVPDGRDFGLVQTGTQAPAQALSVRNVGGEAYDLVELSVGAPFKIESSCPLPMTIAPGEACPVQVSVTPVLDGEVRSLLVAQAIAPAADPLQSVEISGQVPLRAEGFTPADLVLAPDDELAFGPVAVGSSARANVLLANPGSQNLAMLGFFTAAPFHVAGHDCGSVLSGGASCTVQVDYAPIAVGSHLGTFDANGTLQGGGGMLFRSLALSGSAFQPSPILAWSPMQGLDFGSIAFGAVSAVQTATLVNTGNAPASITLSTSGAGFSIVGGSCGATLAAGASCTAQVRFQAASIGAVIGSLSAQAGGASQSAQIALRATGVSADQPAFASTPSAPGPLTFTSRPGEVDQRVVQVSNPGSGSLHVGNPVISGAHAGDFVVLSPLPLIANPLASAQPLIVACAPTAGGTRSAQLTLQTTAAATPSVTFALTCESHVPSFADGFERDPADL